jgi:hypothetical protein
VHAVSVLTCRRCGAVRDDADNSALTWVPERDPDGQVSWFCPECTRRHLRDIEARLRDPWQ